MASPTVVSTATTTSSSSANPLVLNLPASLVTGNTVAMYLRITVNRTLTWPEGWNEFILSDADGSDDVISAAWWKVDDTGATTVSVSLNSDAKVVSIARQYGGAADPTVTPPQAATISTGTDDSPDPGTVTPTGGAKDYLFEALASMAGTPTVSSFPTGYEITPTNEATSAGGAATNARIAIAGKQATASSDNPGPFTYSGSGSWMATAVAIHPAAGGGPTAKHRPLMMTGMG